MPTDIVIGSRGSALALWQTHLVRDLLQAQGHKVEIKIIASQGDQDLQTSLAEIGGQGVFTKALDDALLAGEIDLAVHSCKDLPTNLLPGLQLSALLEREDPADVLVANRKTDAESLINDPNRTARIATGSPRRKAYWQNRYPNHDMPSFRGNVPTRLKKIEDEQLDGAIFAAAGLRRLGLFDSSYMYPLPWMTPAPGQGAIAIVTGSNDLAHHAAASLNHYPTAYAVAEERAFLNTLQAGCTAPVGAHLSADKTFHYAVFDPSGQAAPIINRCSAYIGVGRELANEILESLTFSFGK